MNERCIAPLPLAALRLPAETIEALSQVGLKRIADVLDRPRAPLAARFGAEFVRRIDQALGREDEPIAPRLPVPAAITEQRFAEPIALERDVLGTIEKLAAKLGALLERRGEGARLLQAALFRTDGKVFRIEVGTSEPLREAARIRHLFADRLGVIGDEVDPGFGYDMLRLAALVTERCEPAQTGLAHARSCGGACASHRPARRALRPAPRHAVRRAGYAYSGVCRDGGGGAHQSPLIPA